MAAGAMLLIFAGCHQMPSSFLTASRSGNTAEYRLVAFVQDGPVEPVVRAPEATLPASSVPTTEDPTTQPATQPTTAPASRPAYTAPSPAFQQLGLAAGTAALGVMPEVVGAGKEVSESVTFASQGVVGRSGVTAPATRVNNIIVNRSGPSAGGATGVGFANLGRNLFTASANPASGPNGRCAELAGVGFFNRNPAACVANFARR